MAEKRHLEAVGSIAYSKLPRLEVEPGHLLAAGSCRLNALPGYPLENHYSYKGSYFAYPLQCHESTKSLAPWVPIEAYAHCARNPASQPLMAEKALHTLHRQEAESFHPQGKTPGHKKGDECAAPDALTVSEKWTNYVGHSSLVQQNWVQACTAQHTPQATSSFPTLAAPKPVYRNHSYFTEAGYTPKHSLAFGIQVENVPKRPLGTDWTLPTSRPPPCLESAPSYDAGAAKKAVVSGSRFTPGHHQGSKEAAFSPFRKVFDSCQGTPDTAVLEATYPAAYNCWRTTPDARSGSPSKHTWSKLPLPASPLAASQSLTHPDKSLACYPFPSYPLMSSEQMILYHQTYAQVDKSNALYAFPACKELSSSGGEHSQLLPGPYFPSVSRNYYPPNLEPYLYPSIAPPAFQPSKEHEQQKSLRTKLDSLQEAPISACSLPEKVSYCGASSGRDALLGWGEVGQVAKAAHGSLPSQWSVPRSEAPHAPQSFEKPPEHFSEFGQMREAGCEVAVGQSEKANHGGKDCPYTPKGPTSASEMKKRSPEAHRAEPGPCMVDSDSLTSAHDPFLKEDLLKNILKDSASPAEERAGNVETAESPAPPSSPPMPVIHNVFSLAPYQEYLEGTNASAEVALSKRCRAEELSGAAMEKCVVNEDSPWPDSALLLGKEAIPDSRMEVGQGGVSNSHAGEGKGSGGYGEQWENYALRCGPPNGPVPGLSIPVDCQNGRGGEVARADCALDLRFKVGGLVEPVGFQKSPRTAEDAEREMSKRTEEDMGANPAKKLKASHGTEHRASELAGQGGSGTKSHFHSSAEFMFKKFRIQKSHTAGAGSVTQKVSSSYEISAKIAALANDVHLKPGSKQAAACQMSPPLRQSSHQARPSRNSPTVQPSSHRVVAHPKSSAGQPSSLQVVSQHSGPLVQQSFQVETPQKSLPVQQSLHQVGAQSEACLFLQNCFDSNSPDSSRPEIISRLSPASEKAPALLPTDSKSLGKQHSPRQYFTALHTSVCSIISSTVSASSPEQLKEWLKIAETSGQAKDKSKPKSDARTSEILKEIWLTFKDMSLCFTKLLSQLETFLFTHTCPFPHVVRAGTIFIPIHVVKEIFFPSLSSSSVDHVLQDHRVELRPTTLSEEKLLRDLNLKGCTLRMLKLLALKQLPDIYPDLLNLYWISCVKLQLCPSSQPELHTSK